MSLTTLRGYVPSALSAVRCCLIAVGTVLWLVAGADAQVTSTIQGRITDASGAIIVGGAVKVTNEATGVSRSGKSAADGYFRVTDLLPGSYEVQADRDGFKTQIRKGVDLQSQTVLNLDFVLEAGGVAETVEVTVAVPQIETTESRISTVLKAAQLQALPAIGRGVMWLTVTMPGVQGKAEDNRSGFCCDGLSFLAEPRMSSGGNELKSNFFLDGVSLGYGGSRPFNLTFSPNLDALEEMRVSTNPTSADQGRVSGVQVQLVTKGGTNTFRGTSHFTFLDDSLNAVPYGSNRTAVGNWYQRFFGGTIGGPIVRERLFFFGAYEGLREQRPAASGARVVVETEAFANWVRSTRPNSIAANLLAAHPPFRYATDELRDVNGDGIMDLGTVTMDRVSRRSGHQYNSRVDYQTSSGKDRFYVSYWRTRPSQTPLDVRPTLDYFVQNGSNFISGVHSRAFTSQSLNELRVATWDLLWDWRFRENSYHVPCVQTNDGLGFPSTFSGACSFSRELFKNRSYDISDTFTWNRGAHSWKFGGSYRDSYYIDPTFLFGDTPVYNFRTVIDFANDSPFQETRNVNPATGALRDPHVEAKNQLLSFFAQDSWQVQPGLTMNLGLRWDYYPPFPLTGLETPRDIYGPVYTTDQVTREGIAGIRNRKVERSYDRDLNNFGPRLSVAWDPTKSGRNVIRGGFFVLYDEVDSTGVTRNYYNNPPLASLLNAGSQFGIPIVYGVAPGGTRDFPINPGLVGRGVDPELGILTGTRPTLAGWALDTPNTRVYDANLAFQRQLLTDVAVTVAYHYRRSTNDRLGFNANRVSGDLLDGRLDRLNRHYGPINVNVPWARRLYHGLILDVSKRLSHGWQLSASYSYHNGRTNLGGTEAFNPALDWARDEPATHSTRMNAVWDLPFFRREGVLGAVLGGWQLSTIWNIESGFYVNPTSSAPFGSGGDFNADGQNADRPDLPTTSVPRSYDHEEWLRGALSASIFPRPNTVRNGTLPRNYFHGPGYARIDASLAKKFKVNGTRMVQVQAQATNLLNTVNISSVSSALTATNFGRATAFYPMRAIQLSAKLFF